MSVFLWFLFVAVLTIPAYVFALTGAWLLYRRRLTAGLALVFAIVTLAIVAMILPIYGNWDTTRRFDVMTRANAAPAKRIAIAGNIRLDAVDATEWDRWIARTGSDGFTPDAQTEAGRNWDPGMCGSTCRELLSTPGVASVTVDPVPLRLHDRPSPHAATFRLSAAPCGGLDPCFTRIPTARRFDFHVTRSAGLTIDPAHPTGQSDIETRLRPRSLDIEGVEIRDALDHLLLRQTSAGYRTIDQPLMFAWSLSPYSPHIGFAARYHDNRVEKPLRRWTTVPLDSVRD